MITSNLDPGLWQYELSWEEWKTASQLCDILKFQCLSLLPFATCLIICSMRVFKDMIMFFSQGRPNINSIIPVMDYLDQQLTTSAFNMRYSKLIKASITLGKKTLNWCYDMTDQLKIYCIAMVCGTCLSSCSLIFSILLQCYILAIRVTFCFFTLYDIHILVSMLSFPL